MARMKAAGEYEAVLEHGARVQEQIESGEYVPGRPLREVLAERASQLGVDLDLQGVYRKRRSQPPVALRQG
ncbi:hypothetical protein GCM10023074_61640 [Microbispora amethystogenes]|uniref:Uncharacterized protein n=1 Tax=Microbispora amethystogenes TaxID=1427754 RepID=A0ABQ4FJH4_9ACTN|nr:hypothetical protein Mam01_51300 [Microbispora amethystogenes]